MPDIMELVGDEQRLLGKVQGYKEALVIEPESEGIKALLTDAKCCLDALQAEIKDFHEHDDLMDGCIPDPPDEDDIQ